MRAPFPLPLLTAILLPLVCPPTQAFEDGHSLAAVRDALQSPIPESAVEQARRTDDQILQTGTAMGVKVSLVTDARLAHTQALVTKILVAIGEQPRGWVVRVLDTDPKVVNAFVNGGKYIYVFTGLLDQVQSDSELAVVVGHEIGHSVLKHNIRRNSDLSTTLANLATLVGSIKGGAGGANAMSLGKALHNGYGRDDEREADAFGVLAAWRAGFDPMGGAAFFTRLEQADEKTAAEDDQQLSDYKSQLLALKAKCETERQQWASGQAAHTQQNADIINQNCASYTNGANSYNAQMSQQRAQAITGSDHPADQERIAAIAAEVDWLHGARPLRSLDSYPRTYTVIAALVQDHSPIFAGLLHTTPASTTAVAASSDASTDAQAAATDESQRAIEAERERIAKVHAQERAAAAKAALAKCKPDDMQCRREAAD